MNAIQNAVLGPRTLGPVLAVLLCYPIRFCTRILWRVDPVRRITLAGYLALGTYAAVVVLINYPQFLRWHHVTETLYPALGGVWGIEHAIGFVAAWFVFKRASSQPDIYEDATIFIRGRRLISYEQAWAKASLRIRFAKRALFWGMLPVPIAERVKNFMIVGSPGSGKTVSIQLLLRSILPFIKKGSRTRMLLYDAKTDLFPILAAMNPGCPMHTLNFLDERRLVWDMAKDIRTRKDARELAAIFVPESAGKRDSAFFLEATRLIFQAAIESLILSNKPWTLRDVLLSLKSPSRIEAVLSRHEETRHILKNLGDPETRNNVFSTVQNVRERFTAIAASWHRVWSDPARRISLTEWIKGESILLLGQATAAGSPLRALNQMILQRVSELLDETENSGTEQTWIILDEITDLEYVKGLDLLLRRGRSKGVSTVIGFQTWAGMVRAFGQELATEITGLCSFKSFLGVNDPETAHWSASHFGHQEVLECRVSHSESRSEGKVSSTNRSLHCQQVTRPSVMAEEFLTISAPSHETGFSAYHLSPQVKDGYHSTVAWPWVIGRLKGVFGGSAFEGATFSKGSDLGSLVLTPAFQKEDTKEVNFEYLPEWTDEECKLLGLPPLTEMETPAKGSPDTSTGEKIQNIKRKDLA